MTSKQQGVRVGCYSAFWGDSAVAAGQLITMENPPKYIVADYLAEVTMGILARSRGPAGKSTNPKGGAGRGGFVKEFVDRVYTPHAQTISEKKITLITNAGGLDPVAAKEAIASAAKEAGLEVLPVVAAVFGDDLLSGTGKGELEKLIKGRKLAPFSHIVGPDSDPKDSESWPANPKGIISCNVYLGAEGIFQALQAGANIIVTGRVVDSALVLGPLRHEFGWSPTSWDQLASASLAGHIIECGCHATGGNFTDWKLSAFSENGGWTNMGYPIVEVFKDGSFNVSKPPRTGGLVSVGTVTEQMVYEVLDPGSYLLPDVTLDLRYVQLKQLGPNLVHVSGARGRPPPPSLKTSGKANATGEAIIKRVNQILKQFGNDELKDYLIETLGAEYTYGPNSKMTQTRETVLRITAKHPDKMGLMILARETAPAATCMAPGITGGGAGRATPSPSLNHFSVLVPKSSFPSLMVVGNQTEPKRCEYTAPSDENAYLPPPLSWQPTNHLPSATLVKAKLIDICYGRSGDKGDTCNIGIIARKPEFYPWLVRNLTADTVARYMKHLVHGVVKRYELPGSYSLNFVCTRALGGGGLTSLRIDRQGKTYAQMLLTMELEVPANFVPVSLDSKL
ncbi:hypothetical protein HDU76_013851 [Blyttiomyces sp. JEL0837]|nr:hypothetical protein HDU76_013851 [Blyttiomyces sp. JEL0837]